MTNLPNLLTLSRVFLAPIIMLLLFFENFWARTAALLLFLIAALTDIWDGQVARRRGQVTPLGIFLDPLADKVLIISILIAFVALREIPAWGVVVIIVREFMITGFRTLGIRQGYHLAASKLAKGKTFSQILLIAITVLVMILRVGVRRFPNGWKTLLARVEGLEKVTLWFIDLMPDIMLYIAVFFTIWSAADYFHKNQHILMPKSGRRP